MKRALAALLFFCSPLLALPFAIAAVTNDAIDKNGDGKPDLFVEFHNGKKFKAEEDRNFDGRIDTWYVYDAEGHSKHTANDSNGDGKPDKFTELLKGRNLVMREYDRNFDGRIDKRQLCQWDPDKRIPMFINNRMEYTPNPGYAVLWTEEDNNYDGKVDVYKEKGNKNPSKDRIGKLIEAR